ncbi:MAG: ATP synthase F1 subunit gamma [Elusimicrobiota bacterium]
MISLREIRQKIKSVRSIRKITQTMKMVATARLKRAYGRIVDSRPFAQKLEAMAAELVGRVNLEKTNDNLLQFFLPAPGRQEAFLLLTSDKGLCGSFNTSLFRNLIPQLAETPAPFLIVVGKKGRNYLKHNNYPIYQEHLDLWLKLSFAQAEVLGEELMELYLRKKLSAVKIIYNQFVSPISQKPVIKILLPLAAPTVKDNKIEYRRQPKNYTDYLYEPGKEKVLSALIPRYIKSEIYRALLESYASELGARMNAMDNATKNADEMINALTLTLNKIRQANITQELAELMQTE